MAPTFLVYEAGTLAVICRTQQVVGRVGPLGIRANAICPSHVVAERIRASRWAVAAGALAGGCMTTHPTAGAVLLVDSGATMAQPRGSERVMPVHQAGSVTRDDRRTAWASHVLAGGLAPVLSLRHGHMARP